MIEDDPEIALIDRGLSEPAMPLSDATYGNYGSEEGPLVRGRLTEGLSMSIMVSKVLK